MTKTCEGCGKSMRGVAVNRRFCDTCARERLIEQRMRYEEKRKDKTIERPCRFCGAPTTGDGRRHCHACPDKPAEKRPRSPKKPKEPEKPKKPKKKPLKGCWDLENKSVTHISVEAGALGLSYGHYTSLVDTLFIERYLASEGITDGLERIDRAWKQFKKDKRDFERRLAARIEEEKRNEQELMEIEMGYMDEEPPLHIML